MALITLTEYAQKHGKNRDAAYKKYKLGEFKTAVKRGHDIWIDEDEPYIDNRVKSGKFIGFSKGYSEWKRIQKARATRASSEKIMDK